MNLDWAILNWIHLNMQCKLLDFIMPHITALGDAGFIWISIAGVMLFFKNYRKTGTLMLIGMAIGLLIANVGLKPLIARSRPCWLNPMIPLLIETPLDFSFPSGHTLASVISATIIACSRSRLRFFVIPLAALIAFSRLYLYVHFPSDVLASLVFGLIIGLSVFHIGNKKDIFSPPQK